MNAPPKRGNNPDDTFAKLMRVHAWVRGGRPAYRHKDLGIWRTWTWAEVYAETRALARGLAIAAARELEEETGLSLGTPPALDGLDYLCRAVTPAASPVRFNARFLVVAASRVYGTLGGSGELEGLRWYGLEAALSMRLAYVTRHVILLLRDWLAMTPAQRRTRSRTPLMVEWDWQEE